MTKKTDVIPSWALIRLVNQPPRLPWYKRWFSRKKVVYA